MNLSQLFIFNRASFSLNFFENRKREEEKIKKDKENNKLVTLKTNKYDFNEKQIKLILKLKTYINNFLFRKKVKNLILTNKENYILLNNSNVSDLYLNVITFKYLKRYNVVFEPILNQNIFYLPKITYKNRKKLKFIFSNSKNETFIDPYFHIEYENGELFNVLDLQSIKKKENKNKAKFRKFLNEYIKINENTLNFPDKKEYKLKKDQNLNINIKDNNDEIPFLKNRKKSLFKLAPILKKRKTGKMNNERKISFGTVKFSY